jgi:hypothetical protein
MEIAYLILQMNSKKVDYKNIFLEKENAIKYLNQINENIYKLNHLYLKNKINRIHKLKKKEKYKNILLEFERIYNIINQTPDIPYYINSNFKYIKKLKYQDYYITEIQLNKTISSPKEL